MFIDSTPADNTVKRNMQRDYVQCLNRIPKITACIWRDTLILLLSILLYAIACSLGTSYKAKCCKDLLFRGKFWKTTDRQPEKPVLSQKKNRKFRSKCGRRIECNMNGQLHSTNHLDTTILWIWPARIRQTVGGPCHQMRSECDSELQRGKDCEVERYGLHEDARVFIRIPLVSFTCSSCYLPLVLNGSYKEIYAIKV
jgi:hypothetical protein